MWCTRIVVVFWCSCYIHCEYGWTRFISSAVLRRVFWCSGGAPSSAVYVALRVFYCFIPRVHVFFAQCGLFSYVCAGGVWRTITMATCFRGKRVGWFLTPRNTSALLGGIILYVTIRLFNALYIVIWLCLGCWWALTWIIRWRGRMCGVVCCVVVCLMLVAVVPRRVRGAFVLNGWPSCYSASVQRVASD